MQIKLDTLDTTENKKTQILTQTSKHDKKLLINDEFTVDECISQFLLLFLYCVIFNDVFLIWWTISYWLHIDRSVSVLFEKVIVFRARVKSSGSINSVYFARRKKWKSDGLEGFKRLAFLLPWLIQQGRKHCKRSFVKSFYLPRLWLFSWLLDSVSVRSLRRSFCFVPCNFLCARVTLDPSLLYSLLW